MARNTHTRATATAILLTATDPVTGTVQSLSCDHDDGVLTKGRFLSEHGTSLTFSYAIPVGRRIKMVDQSGFTTNYSYNAQGQLADELTDTGNGNPIVGYSYDADGRAQFETTNA